MSGCIQVVTLAGTRAEAERIATHLVEDRLAACVQVVGPVTSTYHWQERLEQAEEWMCVIKTASARYAAVEQAIRVLHSYQVPEIVATPIVVGSADYLAWIREQTAESSAEE
jgi:periplasmic divalent cation tolerance protein